MAALEAAAGAGADMDHETAAAIAAQNGQGESVGVSSGVLQVRATLLLIMRMQHICTLWKAVGVTRRTWGTVMHVGILIDAYV